MDRDAVASVLLRVIERRVRRAQEVTYRVMSTLGGNLPGFEEGIRGLFARERARFDSQVELWPADIRSYVTALAAPVFEEQP